MPKFQKEFPRDAHRFFDPAYDEEFKKQHPVKYGILVACGIVALVLPMLLLLLLTSVWLPISSSGFLLLGMLGCFIIGIGLFNIVAAFIGQYLGHWVTAICLLLGGGILSVYLVIVYTPDFYAFFDEQMVSYYFATLLFLALPPVFYLIFRLAMDSWLRRKRVSKSKIKKLKKGKRNFWWYESLHAEFDLGLIYHLNKFLTILYPVNLILALTMGWLRFMVPVITGQYVLVSLLTAFMSLFSSAQLNMDAYGQSFVILRRTANQGYTSSILDLFMALFPLAAAHANILMMLDALNIPRP